VSVARSFAGNSPVASMPTLVLSTMSLPASSALADAARTLKWDVAVFDRSPSNKPKGQVTFYGGTDLALAVASRFQLALLEPPFDLLAKLPLEYRRRTVEYARFSDLGRLKAPTFAKPADALNKSFDAGVYSSVRDIRAPRGVDPTNPVLLSEPVEWSAEYRCFIKEEEITAWSPYISFGRPCWKPFGKGTLATETPSNLQSFCKRLFSQSGVLFPPAFVMDIGLIDDRGWGVVEFNPIWCSGLLGADPRKVLAGLKRACHDADRLSIGDRRWVIERTIQVK
jgi:ATP-grasp domain, R2K clade family 3